MASPDALSKAILVVDDEAPVRRMLSRLLQRQGYECLEAGDANEAREVVASKEVGLVLADMNMPGESGMDLLNDLLAREKDLAAIMVTGVDDTALAEAALEIGAYGYVIKPFETSEILINVSNAFRRRSLEIENRGHREKLEKTVKQRTADLWKAIQDLEHAHNALRESQAETVERLSFAAEFRDDETARHIQRMSRYCAVLVEKLEGDSERAELVRVASVMHDVGKIGIPDSILLKPGKLTPEEYRTMQQHAEFGYKILSGGKSPLLNLAATIAVTHHEKIDGTGYPKGLKGEEIPLEGRIAAVADVFDALTTNRVYRKAFTLPESMRMMTEGRGTHFDADLLDLFFDSMDLVLRIKEENE